MRKLFIILSFILSCGVVVAPLTSTYGAEEEIEIEMDDVGSEYEEVELLYNEKSSFRSQTKYSLWYVYGSSISEDDDKRFVSLNKPIKSNLFLHFNSLIFYE